MVTNSRASTDLTQRSSVATPKFVLQQGSPASSEDLSVARNHSLLDDIEMEDDSPMSPVSPSKRRRMTTSGAESYGWQGFCRKGTQIKALLDDAFVNVVSASNTTRNSERQMLENSGSTYGSQMDAIDSLVSQSTSSASVANIARQKTAECIFLQTELEKVKMEQTQLQALNNELREAERHQATRMQKMTTALNLASQNAAKARVDADAAEVTAATLATQLQALQQVVDETKRASRVLLNEQEEMSRKTQTTEQQYVQTQAELARANAQRQKIQKQNLELQNQTKSLEGTVHELKTQLDHQNAEIKQWKRQNSELKAMEESQQERMQRVEKELQQAQTLLVDATATAAETEATSTELKNSMEKLQQANKQLHKQLEEQQVKARSEREVHQNRLQAAEKENQALKNKDLNTQDQIKQLAADKQAQEKRFSQLQVKTKNLERRLHEATSLVETTKPAEKNNDLSTSICIPTLGKENNNQIPTVKCSICFKGSSGLMKKCQCGKPGCTHRAHATCANKASVGPSVSHPGTPAPRLPLVLCGGSLVAAITPMALKTTAAEN